MNLQKDKLLVKPHQGQEEEYGGLILPATMKRLSYSATVMQMSAQNGWFDFVELGDEVFYDKYVGRDITLNGEAHEIIDQSDVAVIKKKNPDLLHSEIKYTEATEALYEGSKDLWMKIDEAAFMAQPKQADYIIPANYLLVKAKAQHEDFDIGGGQKILLDTSYHKEKFAVTFGEVICTPEKYLFFGEELNEKEAYYSPVTIMKFRNHTLNYKNKPLVEIGDKVHFHYLSIQDAIVKGFVLPCDEDGYDLYLIRYDACFCFERKEQIIFINGYCGVEIRDADAEKDGFFLTDDEKKLKNWGKGILRYMSEPNEAYVHYPEIVESVCPAVVGDTIYFQSTKRSKVANDLFVDKPELKEIFYIQRKDISFVLTNC